MLKIIYPPEERTAAESLIAELNRSGLSVDSAAAQTREDLLIALITPAVQKEKNGVVQSAIYTALDNGQQIIPILLNGAQPPKLIDHLNYVDFTNGANYDAVRALIAELTAPGAKIPLKVLTPNARKQNRAFGWIVAIAAIVMFVVGLYGVGVLGIQAPAEEYEAVDEAVEATIAAEIAPPLATMRALLPTNPDEAWVYPATLLAAPTRYRPFIAGTATALATERGIYPATLTPTPGGN